MVGEEIVTLSAPARHHTIMHSLCKDVPESQWPAFGAQGFVTDTGRFVGRAEAFRIAGAAKQFLPDCPRSVDTLYSEDVW